MSLCTQVIMDNAILKPLLYFIAPQSRWNSDTGKWLLPCAHPTPTKAYNALGDSVRVDWHALHPGKTANPEEGRDVLSSKLETTSYFQLLASCGMQSRCICLFIPWDITEFLAVFYNFLVGTMVSYSLKIVWAPFCLWFAYSLGLGVRIKHTVLSQTRTAFVFSLRSFPAPGLCGSLCIE